MKSSDITVEMPVTIKVQADDVTKCHYHCIFSNIGRQDAVCRCRLYHIQITDEARCSECIRDFDGGVDNPETDRVPKKVLAGMQPPEDCESST